MDKCVVVKLDAAEIKSLVNIVRPLIAMIFQNEHVDVAKAVKDKDIASLDNMTALGKQAFIAAITISKLEESITNKVSAYENNANAARA